jgi:hypothetical protein
MRVAVTAVALASLFGAGHAHAQFQTLSIPVGVNASPVRPAASINTLQEMMHAIRGCWSPPPLDPGQQPIDLLFRVSFKRSGELFGKPPTIEFVQEVTPQQRERYYRAVAEMLDRCSKMPFTEAMGGAVAGRVFKINFIDMRKRKQTSWPTTKTS